MHHGPLVPYQHHATMPNRTFVVKHLMQRSNLIKNKSEVFLRQEKLQERYATDPSLALITDRAEVIGKNLHDPFRTEVSINEEIKVPFKAGVHRAVGGDHDAPNPGDLLCASLAVCFESTLRMIAGRLGIELVATKVIVTALVDVRGTLMLDRSVPVAFQSMHLEADIDTGSLSSRVQETLIRATKRSCIIYRTLKAGTPITMTVNGVSHEPSVANTVVNANA